MTKRFLLLSMALAACTGPPLVDMTDVDPVVYQRDLDACEAESQGHDTVGPVVAGTIMGASVGAGLGAIVVGPPTALANTAATAYSLGGGAVAGASASAASGRPLAAPPPAPLQTVAQCLEAHGYKVIAPAAP